LFRRRLVTLATLLALPATAIIVSPVTATGGPGVRQISAEAVTTVQATEDGSGDVAQPEIGLGQGDTATDSASGTVSVEGPNRSRSHDQGGAGRGGGGEDKGGHNATQLTVLTSFDGMNHRQQRLANRGNQFSLEPPDQGLCIGAGFVVEVINSVIRVFDTSGHPLTGVGDLNTFLGYPAAIHRAPLSFGPTVTDPSCYYDKDTNRWFADALTLDRFPVTDVTDQKKPIRAGDFTGTNHLDLAVSASSDPTGTWTIYRLPVQDDGTAGTPDHGCMGVPPLGQPTQPTNPNACLGDYPHLGADANGIYLTTNQYSFFGPEFHGAQIYAFSKRALASGGTVTVTQIDTAGLDNGNSGFTIWPATAPNGVNETAANGTEYFMSSNAADEAHGDGTSGGPRESRQLLIWALTNTASLDSDNPSVQLSHTVLKVGEYALPPASDQKAGDVPLGACLNDTGCATFLNGRPDPFAPETESTIDSNDTRMQQVTFANGELWGALDTALRVRGTVEAGIEWFIIEPSVDGGSVEAAVGRLGYLGLANNNLTYPAVGVTSSGHGVVAFTVTGADYYPSAGFAAIDDKGVGTIQIAAAGAGPVDGLSDYKYYGNPPSTTRPRWGDYGAAVADGNSVWIASEYIGQTCDLATYEGTATSPFGSCNGTRSSLANWDTHITQVQVETDSN
jgi:hypothetical protein